MKKQVVLGVILGLLVSGTMAMAQTQPDRSQKPIKKIKRTSAPKKSAVKSKTVLKSSSKSVLGKTNLKPVSKFVAGAPPSRFLNPRSLYAQNTVGTPATATDSPSQSPGNKVLINPPLSVPPTATTSTPLAPAAAAPKKSPFSFKYRSLNAENISSLEMPNDPSQDHEVQAWDRFNFSYSLTDSVSVSLMPQIYHTWFGDRDRSQSSSTLGLNQPYAFYMGDTGLYLIDSKIAEFGGFTLDGSQAYFFSTSEASIQAGTIGQTRTSLGLGRSFGPFDVKVTEMFWYDMQQYQTSSLFSSNGMPLQNLNYEVWSLLDLGWNVTKKFSINFESGFLNQASDPDDNTGRTPVLNDFIILDPEIDYTFSEHFSLGLGIWEQYDMRNPPAVVTQGTGASAVPVAWLPQYYPFDYRNGSQAYLQTTIKF